MRRRFRYVGQVQGQPNQGSIGRRPWNKDSVEDDGSLPQHGTAFSAQCSPQGASRPSVACNGGESGGRQETVLRLQRQLCGYAPVCGGRHQRGTAKPAHAAEVLFVLSPGTPAEQADKDGAF